MGVMTNIKSNVLDVASKGATIRMQGAALRLRESQYKEQNSIARGNLSLRSKMLDAATMKTSGSTSKSVLDQAIKVHNKKLEVISKANKDAAQYGGAQQPLPKFSDTLRDDFGITQEQDPSLQLSNTPTMPMSVGQSTPQMSNVLNTARNIGIGQVPTANRGSRIAGPLKQVLDSMPQPKNVVNPRLPKLQDTINALNDYNNPKDAIAELVQMHDQYAAMGLDIADIEQNNAFQNAFRSKFGDQALAELERALNENRAGGSY